MDGLFKGKGAKGLKQYEALPQLHRLKESKYRKELFLVKDEEIVTLEIKDGEVLVKTTLGELTLTEDGRLFEDGVCYDELPANNSLS
jgi:hypothetical protein